MQNQKRGRRHFLWWTVFVLRAFAALVCLSEFLKRVGEIGPHGGWTFSTFAWFSGFSAFAVMVISIVQRPGRVPAVHEENAWKLRGTFAELVCALIFIDSFSAGWTRLAWMASSVLLVSAGWYVDQKRREHQLEKERAPAFFPAFERELVFRLDQFELDRKWCGYVYVEPSDEERSIGKMASTIVMRPYVPPGIPSAEEKSIGKMPPPLVFIPREFPSDEERRIGKMLGDVHVLSWREALVGDLLDLVAPEEEEPPPLMFEDIRERYVPPPPLKWGTLRWRRSKPDARLVEAQDPNLAPPPDPRLKKPKPPTMWERAEFRRQKNRELLERYHSGHPRWRQEEEPQFQYQDAAD